MVYNRDSSNDRSVFIKSRSIFIRTTFKTETEDLIQYYIRISLQGLDKK
jgi:hypothetical protein